MMIIRCTPPMAFSLPYISSLHHPFFFKKKCFATPTVLFVVHPKNALVDPY